MTSCSGAPRRLDGLRIRGADPKPCELHKQLRMSKQEIRDEMKESEGNPQIKGQIRRLRRELLRRRMMQDVPTATAVIVNPTHYAVAIRYEMDRMASPLVVAKGKNYLALRIRQKAIETVCRSSKIRLSHAGFTLRRKLARRSRPSSIGLLPKCSLTFIV